MTQKVTTKNKLVYELIAATRISCKIEIPKHVGLLKGVLAPIEYAAIAAVSIGSRVDVQKALLHNTEEGCWKKFQSMNAQSEKKSYLEAELLDIFGSYTTVNHAIMHNIPPVLLSFM